MFSVYRATSRPIARSLIRYHSTELVPVGHSASGIRTAPKRRRTNLNPKPKETPTPSHSLNGKVPVREDHGLYAFFRRKPADDLNGKARYEVVETPEEARVVTGRAWEAAELRLKSFKDLHTLWYVSLREKNLLATQKEETRRMGVTHTSMQVSEDKVRHCRKTMARIKAVLNERRLAYEGAVKLVEQQKEKSEEQEDLLVEKFQQVRQRRSSRRIHSKRSPTRSSASRPLATNA